MLVEHSFVTTLSFEEVYSQCERMLTRMGFTTSVTCWKCNYDLRGTIPQGGTACPECGASLWQHTSSGATPRAALLAKRGKESNFNARKTDDLPQSVRVEYDRGRCNVAASIMEQKKADHVHRQMVLAVVRGLELLLVGGDPETGVNQFQSARDAADRYDAERRRKRNIGCLIVFLFVLFLIIAIAVMVSKKII